MADPIIIYGSSISPFVRKVHAMGHELGIAFETRNIGLGSTDPAFLAASPFSKIPALSQGDFHLADSSAIAHYFDALMPGLIPTDPQPRARTIWFDEAADTILVGVMGKIFFNRVVAPRFMRQPGDQAAADHAEAVELPPILDWLETQIPPSGHLVEDRPTLADLSIASPFANLAYAGITVDPERHPRLAAYTKAILARESFAAPLAQDARMLARR